jgi:hypothetical protein
MHICKTLYLDFALRDEGDTIAKIQTIYPIQTKSNSSDVKIAAIAAISQK